MFVKNFPLFVSYSSVYKKKKQHQQQQQKDAYCSLLLRVPVDRLSRILLDMVLLSILKKLRRKEKEMRLLLVGLDNAGKSTILSRINGEEIDTVAPTLGFNIKTFNYADYVLNVWDVGRCICLVDQVRRRSF